VNIALHSIKRLGSLAEMCVSCEVRTGFYIPEDGILHSEKLKSYKFLLSVLAKELHNTALRCTDQNILNSFSCVVNNEDKLLSPFPWPRCINSLQLNPVFSSFLVWEQMFPWKLVTGMHKWICAIVIITGHVTREIEEQGCGRQLAYSDTSVQFAATWRRCVLWEVRVPAREN
jgi:hypothetical protein